MSRRVRILGLHDLDKRLNKSVQTLVQPFKGIQFALRLYQAILPHPVQERLFQYLRRTWFQQQPKNIRTDLALQRKTEISK